MTVIEQQVIALLRDGHAKSAVARHLSLTRPKVQRIARKYAGMLSGTSGVSMPNDTSANVSENVLDRTFKQDGDTASVETRVPRFIATLDEAIAAAGVDTVVWDVVGWESRSYPLQTKDGPVQGSYVKLKLAKRSLSMNAERIIDAVTRGLESALSAKVVTPRAVTRYTRPKVLRTRIITDLHFGGYAWDRNTGSENYDIAKASAKAFAANRYLDAQVPDDVTETLMAFLGDIFHYDTPGGTTTGGTQLDLDSRVDLMLAAASEYCVTTVAEEAEKRPVTVLVCEGNHDAILSKALRRMLLLVFAKHRNVTVREEYTPRQYVRWGGNLLGFTHGDGSRQRLVDAMAVECGNLGIWDGAKCREYHHGHIHTESQKQKVLWGAEALQGTVVRSHIALVPTDGYHAKEGWVGNVTGMSDWLYHHSGAMIGSRVAVSHLLEAA